MANTGYRYKGPFLIGAFALFVGFIAGLVTSRLEDGAALWMWVGVAVQSVAAITVVVCLISVVRGQREDYWRERGTK